MRSNEIVDEMIVTICYRYKVFHSVVNRSSRFLLLLNGRGKSGTLVTQGKHEFQYVSCMRNT